MLCCQKNTNYIRSTVICFYIQTFSHKAVKHKYGTKFILLCQCKHTCPGCIVLTNNGTSYYWQKVVHVQCFFLHRRTMYRSNWTISAFHLHGINIRHGFVLVIDDGNISIYNYVFLFAAANILKTCLFCLTRMMQVKLTDVKSDT